MLLQALTAVAVVVVGVAAAHLLSAMGHLVLLLLNFEAHRPRLASSAPYQIFTASLGS